MLLHELIELLSWPFMRLVRFNNEIIDFLATQLSFVAINVEFSPANKVAMATRLRFRLYCNDIQMEMGRAHV